MRPPPSFPSFLFSVTLLVLLLVVDSPLYDFTFTKSAPFSVGELTVKLSIDSTRDQSDSIVLISRSIVEGTSTTGEVRLHHSREESFPLWNFLRYLWSGRREGDERYFIMIDPENGILRLIRPAESDHSPHAEVTYELPLREARRALGTNRIKLFIETGRGGRSTGDFYAAPLR